MWVLVAAISAVKADKKSRKRTPSLPRHARHTSRGGLNPNFPIMNTNLTYDSGEPMLPTLHVSLRCIEPDSS